MVEEEDDDDDVFCTGIVSIVVISSCASNMGDCGRVSLSESWWVGGRVHRGA